jgi:phosphatidylserine/phosphatidylglycerophosphate/cardiolipin synthase-like enzyme
MPFTSTMRDVPATRRSRVWRRTILLVLAAVWIATAYWQANKPMPPGAHVDSPWYPLTPQDVTFIADITAADAYGRPIVSQAIFDQVLGVVGSAHKFIVLDYFLFNAQVGASEGHAPVLRQISGELRDALIERRRTEPDLQVLFITDPINDVYGGATSRDLRLLRAAGVDVVVTNLDRLRDSNYLYSSIWRLGIRWWSGGGRAAENAGASDSGWLPNPLDESAAPVSFGAWARLFNFKSNHRKVVIADDSGGGIVAIVGSANVHDASSSHSNVALKITGPAVLPLLQSELDVARFSGWRGQLSAAAGALAALESPTTAAAAPVAQLAPSGARMKVLTEGGIRAELLERLDATVRGDNIDIAMFYLADRGVIEALLAASRRGVTVRLILDPNKDAFGHARTGIPNQPVASELVAASDGAIHVRWYRTHGEQFHTKLAMIYGRERLWLTLGSANFTRRNLADYDLEANVALEVDRGSQLALQTVGYFDTLWSNRASLGIEYTADFGYYADPSQLHYWLYRIMEGTGVSTF